MALKDMALTPDEAREEECCAPSHDMEDGGPRYPYGLTVYLDDTVLSKLGLTQLPAVGTQLTLTAAVTVKAVDMRQRQGKEDENSVDLQITAMELGAAPAAGGALYKA